MGLFDIFTTDAQDKAAESQKAGIQAGMAQYGQFAGQGRDALNTNYGAGISSLADYTGQGVNALNANYGAGSNALNANYGAGSAALSGNYAAGIQGMTDAYGQAVAPSQYNFAQGQAGTGALGNALGLNGPQGNAQATQAFWNNPGIQAQLNIGSENVMRKAAATGGPASGSTLTALQDYGQQVASQGWNNYVSQLQPYLNYSQGAAQNIGSLYSGYGTNLANQYANLGNQQSSLSQNLGNQQAGLSQNLGNQVAGQYGNLGNQTAGQYANLGNQLAASYGTQGNVAYGGQTGMGNAQANADLAGLNASGNIWGVATGLAGAALGAPGVGSSVGKLGTALGNSFNASNALNSNTTNGGYTNPIGPTQQTFNWSDRRIKEGVEKLAEMADGTNIYRFRYKADPSKTTHIGLMAQEVEKSHPEAVIEIGGIKAVDYKRATDYASGLMKLAA